MKQIDTENMMIERARVSSLPVDGLLWVERLPPECDSCSAKLLCMCNLRGAKRHYRTQVRLPEGVAPSGIALNQLVEIGIATGSLLGVAMRFYVIPTFALIAGALLAQSWWQSEIMTVIGGIGGLALAILMLRNSQRVRFDKQYYPVLLRVLQSKD